MAKIDARDWVFEIKTGPTAWTEIGGLTSWEEDPDAGSESVDDTTFKSAGNSEGHITQRGSSLKLEGFREVDDENDDAVDPGQLAVDVLGAAKGRASLGGIRFRHVAQTDWTVWNRAFVNLGARGGGNNDNTSWGATFTLSGAAATVAVTP